MTTGNRLIRADYTPSRMHKPTHRRTLSGKLVPLTTPRPTLAVAPPTARRARVYDRLPPHLRDLPTPESLIVVLTPHGGTRRAYSRELRPVDKGSFARVARLRLPGRRSR